VRTSKGSGFFISADGYAVTNCDVTAESEKVELITDDRKSIGRPTLHSSRWTAAIAPPHTREVQAVPQPRSSDPESDLGLKFAPAAQTPESETQGVVVIGIDPEGRAADLGIEAGDLIIEVSGKAVHTPDDISTALNAAHGRGRQAALMRLKSGDKYASLPFRWTLRWPQSFEHNFRVVKWIVGRGYAAVRSGSGSK
jgi:S1-C subfamily serine protease